MSTAQVSIAGQASVKIAEHGATYNNAIGYLRAFTVLLVVAHHAALTYHPFAPPAPTSLVQNPRIWLAFPVFDSRRWSGATWLVGFNDVFFMSLMFFLSGLFVWNGLQRKGPAAFVRDRMLRLGIPFVIAAAILAPLAYYPSYLQTAHPTGFGDFAHQWLNLGNWPAGPAWFIWVLLVFDCIAALLFLIDRRWGDSLGQQLSGASARPIQFFALLTTISLAVYVPLALKFTAVDWFAFGPFAAQTSRFLHYLAYFMIGVGVGALGLNRGLLAPGGKLSRRWPLWLLAAIVIFLVAAAVTLIALTTYPQSNGWAVAYDSLFSFSCAASCLAFMALFVRFTKSRSSFFDSLSRNSYGIYIVHYAIVSWLQLAMTGTSFPGAAKFIAVFIGAVTLSWLAASTFRRIPAVARIV